MKFTATQIAQLLNGTIEGDQTAIVSNFAKIEEGAPNTISFLANPKYTPFIYTTDASLVIVNKTLQLEKPIKSTCTLIRVDDAYASFAILLDMYTKLTTHKKGIEKNVHIEKTASLGKDCYVAAFAYIGQNVKIGNNTQIYPHVYIGDNCVIGDNCKLFSGVKIYHECVLGNNVTVHANTVIGSDGFGFAPQTGKEFVKVPQIGNVIIGNNVEVGSNCSIDRATMGSTKLANGVKLDNLVQIAHNVEVGENTVIAGLSGVAGSTKVGKNCMIAAQVGIVGHIKIADGVKIAGQAGVGTSIEKENEIVQGSPAFNLGEFRRSYVLMKKLPELNKRLSELEKINKLP